MQKVRLTHLFAAAFFTVSIHAAPIAIAQEQIEEFARRMDNLKAIVDTGQTIKAEREAKAYVQYLKSIFSLGKTFAFPEGCWLDDNPSEYYRLSCPYKPAGKDDNQPYAVVFNFEGKIPQKILEKYQSTVAKMRAADEWPFVNAVIKTARSKQQHLGNIWLAHGSYEIHISADLIDVLPTISPKASNPNPAETSQANE